MKLLALIAIIMAVAHAQFFGGFRRPSRPFGGFRGGFLNMFGGGHRSPHRGPPLRHFGGGFGGHRGPQSSGPVKIINKGTATESPIEKDQSNDEKFPRDCGRNEEGKGNLCFPVGDLCVDRVNRAGTRRYGNHNYWFSWESDDPQLRNTEWDWFNARNYCRKRCMDLVSFETPDEYNWVKQQMNNVKYIWTSGRLCDFDGCEAPRFFPKHINGWFWSANQATIAATDGSRGGFGDWSFTGGSGQRQPDNREGGESCLAVLNNFYGDGIKWHDVNCEHEKPIVCEDVEGHINYARQQFPNINIP